MNSVPVVSRNTHIGEDICPHLGLVDDPSTFVGFPSFSNYCHRAHPASPANFEHQWAYCLVEKHAECQLFTQTGVFSMPMELQAPEPRSNHRQHKIFPIIFIIFLIFLVGGGIYINIHSERLNPLTSPWISTDSATSSSQVLNYSATAVFPSATTGIPGITQTMLSSRTASHASKPKSTPTPRPTLRLEVKLGLGNQFIIHKIVRAESLDLFAEKYNTNTRTLEALNPNIPVPIIVNKIIVIPIGILDPRDLPAFEPYKVIGEKIEVAQLAQQLSVDANLLAYYNALKTDTTLFPGDWVLVPHTRATATP